MAIVLAQSGSTSSGGSSGQLILLGVLPSVAGNNLVLAGGGFFDAGNPGTPTVSDTGGGSWDVKAFFGGGAGTIVVWTAIRYNVPTGSIDITADFTAGGATSFRGAFRWDEWSGMSTTSARDSQVGNAPAGQPTSWSSASISPVDPNCLIIAIAAAFGGAAALWAANSGWTTMFNLGDPTDSVNKAVRRTAVASNGPFTTTWTWLQNTSDPVDGMFAFRPPQGAASGLAWIRA